MTATMTGLPAGRMLSFRTVVDFLTVGELAVCLHAAPDLPMSGKPSPTQLVDLAAYGLELLGYDAVKAAIGTPMPDPVRASRCRRLASVLDEYLCDNEVPIPAGVV